MFRKIDPFPSSGVRGKLSYPVGLDHWIVRNVQHNIYIMNQLLSQTCETNQNSLQIKRAEMIRYVSSIVTRIIRIHIQVYVVEFEVLTAVTMKSTWLQL